MIVLIIAAFLLASCSSGKPVQTSAPSADVRITEETEFTTTSEEIIETKDTEMTTMASESIDMENIVLEINGVEQVGAIGQDLPRDVEERSGIHSV